MAGSELDGLDGADGAMFSGAVWVLTPVAGTADITFAHVAGVVAELGAEVVAMAPDRHDEMVAVVSHVPHLTAASLMGVAADRAEEHAALLRLAAGGFRDMTRVASGQPDIWLDICAENRPAIVSALDALIDRLGEMREIVRTDARDDLHDRLQRARDARTNLPIHATHPEELAEVRIPIPDRTGRGRRDLHAGRRARRQHRQLRGRPPRREQRRRRRRARRRRRRRPLPRRPDRPRLPPGRHPPELTSWLTPAPDRRGGPARRRGHVPGSKSIANRALVCAALADGDSRAARRCPPATTRWRWSAASPALGVGVAASTATRPCVDGTGGGLAAGPVTPRRRAWPARRRGSSRRVAALAAGPVTIDGAPPLRRRPMGPLHDALAALGADVDAGDDAGPPAGHGHAARCAAAARSTLRRRRVQPVPHRADADRAAARRRAAAAPDDAAGLGAVLSS